MHRIRHSLINQIMAFLFKGEFNMSDKDSYMLCMCLCIIAILFSLVSGMILSDSEIKGFALIGLVLLVLCFGLYLRECVK